MQATLASFHPQIVHFVVGLLFVGVVLRIVSLSGKIQWTSAAATTLILIGTAAAVLAVESGTGAHGPVERIPGGTRAIVVEHEELGKNARNVFLGVTLIEILGLMLGSAPSTRTRVLRAVSGLVGLVGCGVLYETAEHGGELVYSYGGGPGIRTGDPNDIDHLLLAGLYHKMTQDRKDKRFDDAALRIQDMAKLFPGDTTIRFLQIETVLQDQKNPQVALAMLDSMPIPESNRLYARAGLLRVDALVALSRTDSARALLQKLATVAPNNRAVRERLQGMMQ